MAGYTRNDPIMNDRDQLITGLRTWIEKHDPHVRAAVNLLIEQARWLDNDEFVVRCVHLDQHNAWIDWTAARGYVESGPPCSGGELIMLQLAVDLGSDRYQFYRLDGQNRHLAVEAFTQAARW